jgi:hypothetical protein
VAAMTPRRSVGRQVSRPARPNAPCPIHVRVRDGEPIEVDGERVAEQVEDWLVEGWWWTERPVRRRYWELVTVTGRNRVVFHDLRTGGWYAQAA